MVCLCNFYFLVLSSVLTEAGLDGGALITATQDQQIKDQLRKNTDRCVYLHYFRVIWLYGYMVGGLYGCNLDRATLAEFFRFL